MENYDVILDCYTDEPSRLGAPPYLGVHARYLAGTLESAGRKYYYLTIDDLRVANGEKNTFKKSFNKRILNPSKNTNESINILEKCENIYVVMGCFVKYEYVSLEPPTFREVEDLLRRFGNKNKVLFYALGGSTLSKRHINKVIPRNLFSDIVFGNIYNYFLNKKLNSFSPNYDRLKKIALSSAGLLKQTSRPHIIEIETAIGCNRKPGCSFCIENLRDLPLQFRDPEDITEEVIALYSAGARYFRLGRQPNFYSYFNTDPKRVEFLLKGIREKCPKIKTLHIDNVSPHNVVSEEGEEITKLIVKYCTSGNIAPFGVESFDKKVRKICNLNGSVDDIHNSISILNRYGSERGEDGMPLFLPGINIIYGLPGQSEKTLSINLENFKKILDDEMLIRRVFVRKLTSPFGEQFDIYSRHQEDEYQNWVKTIEENFIIPMLEKVYPVGTEIKGLRMEMYKNGNSILRKLGTCPVRVVINNRKLILDNFYNVKVIKQLKNRTIEGELI